MKARTALPRPQHQEALHPKVMKCPAEPSDVVEPGSEARRGPVDQPRFDECLAYGPKQMRMEVPKVSRSDDQRDRLGEFLRSELAFRDSRNASHEASMAPDLDAAVDPLHEVSERLFRRKHRLHVCRAILETDPPIVHGRELADRLGIPDGRVGKELHTLAQLGFLHALPKPKGQQIREYQVVEGPFWDLIRSLVTVT